MYRANLFSCQRSNLLVAHCCSTLCGKSKWASLCISQTKIFDTIIHIKLFVLKYANERDRWTDNTTHCWHNATFLWLVFASVWQYWHRCKTMLQNIWRRPLLASPCTFLKNLLRHYAICASNHDEYTCAVGILVSGFNKEKVQVGVLSKYCENDIHRWCQNCKTLVFADADPERERGLHFVVCFPVFARGFSPVPLMRPRQFFPTLLLPGSSGRQVIISISHIMQVHHNEIQLLLHITGLSAVVWPIKGYSQHIKCNLSRR